MGALPFQALDIFQANHKDLDSKVQRDYVASFASCKTLHGPFVQKTSGCFLPQRLKTQYDSKTV